MISEASATARGAVGPNRARGEIGLGGGATQIVDDQLVPGLLQIRGHPRTHHPQADKPDLHHALPRLIYVVCGYFSTSLATSAAVIAAGQPA